MVPQSLPFAPSSAQSTFPPMIRPSRTLTGMFGISSINQLVPPGKPHNAGRRALPPHRERDVAEAAVVDTHALLFHAAGGKRLGAKARRHLDACERQQAIAYIPTPVIWECSLLAKAVRINLHRPTRAFFDDLFSNPAFQPFDLTPEHVFLADEMRFTRDPFDALIVAAAQDLGLPLITRDAAIRESGATEVLW